MYQRSVTALKFNGQMFRHEQRCQQCGSDSRAMPITMLLQHCSAIIAVTTGDMVATQNFFLLISNSHEQPCCFIIAQRSLLRNNAGQHCLFNNAAHA